MVLSVPATRLHGFSGLLRRAADDAAEARGYVRRHGAIGSTEQGLLTRVIDLHGDLAETVTAAMGRLERVLRASADEVERAVGDYRASDLREASRMDAARRKVRP
ncbi:hypothetical protein [Streptomyces sp. NPDC051162]|uniref:hypothetical protein n=1 Tax=Streptomyces sp. NPDC051162 TaxID=3154747 RepID=UPI003436DE1A